MCINTYVSTLPIHTDMYTFVVSQCVCVCACLVGSLVSIIFCLLCIVHQPHIELHTHTNKFIHKIRLTYTRSKNAVGKQTHTHTYRQRHRQRGVLLRKRSAAVSSCTLSLFALALSFVQFVLRRCAAVHLSLCCYLIDSLLLPLLFLLSLLVQLLLSAFKHIGYTCSLCKAATVTGSTGVGAVVQSYCPAHCAHTYKHTHTATLYMGNLCEKRCQNMHWHVCVCVCVGICMYVCKPVCSNSY